MLGKNEKQTKQTNESKTPHPLCWRGSIILKQGSEVPSKRSTFSEATVIKKRGRWVRVGSLREIWILHIKRMFFSYKMSKKICFVIFKVFEEKSYILN